MMQLGDWRIDIVSGGHFLHDGGVLYGVVPKTIWQKVTPADSQNRVPLAMNCLLARNGRYTVLIDTGHGDKLSPLECKAHGLETAWPLLEQLRRLGVSAGDIDAVVLSHLHWDHAGGATTRVDGQLTPTFPRATYYINRREWEDASSAAIELSGGYMADDFLPLLQHGRIVLTEPEQEIVPGIQVVQTGGHTRGHQAVVVESRDEGILYLGDIAPTTAHVRRMWCTAYDLDLIQSRQVKTQWFAYAADRQYHVVWNHDRQAPCTQVARHSKREFVIVG